MVSTTFVYPHYLYVLVEQEATQDTNGDWLKPSSSWVLASCCRAETNGKANEVNTSDGRVLVYSDMVYTPIGRIANLCEGTMVAVLKEERELASADLEALRKDGTLRAMGKVVKYDDGRLHNRIWINTDKNAGN